MRVSSHPLSPHDIHPQTLRSPTDNVGCEMDATPKTRLEIHCAHVPGHSTLGTYQSRHLTRPLLVDRPCSLPPKSRHGGASTLVTQ
jgi:hypothetical protein